MTPEQYKNLQITNQRLFELCQNNEIERRKYLEKMQEDEAKFLSSNLGKIALNEAIPNESIGLVIPKEMATLNVLPKPNDIIYGFEKVTPENFFTKGSFTDTEGNDVPHIEKLLKSNPEILQLLCNRINTYVKLECEETLKKIGAEGKFDIVEDKDQIKLIPSPSKENPMDNDQVNSIVQRAVTIAEKQSKQENDSRPQEEKREGNNLKP